MLGIGKVAPIQQQPQQMRGGGPQQMPNQQQQQLPAANRFLQPVSKCDMSLTDLIGT